MMRFILALAMAAAILGSLTVSKPVLAQEILLEGPLAGEPAVRKLIQYRKLRVSVGPQVGYTILNDYMHNILLGGRLEFNLTDWLGIGGVGYYALNITTKLTDHITDASNIGGESTVPSESNYPSYTGSANFKHQVAQLKMMFLGQVSLVPFRGKMSMFEKLFVGLDWEIFFGGGVVMFDERSDCIYTDDVDSRTCEPYFDESTGELLDPNDYKPTRDSRTTGVFSFGSGFAAYFNDWFAVHLEYRVTPFRWNAGGTDEAGQSGGEWEQMSIGEDDEGNPIYTWTYSEGGGEGDYPDGRINKDDRKWNWNQSIAIGFLFHFPFKPSIAK